MRRSHRWELSKQRKRARWERRHARQQRLRETAKALAEGTMTQHELQERKRAERMQRKQQQTLRVTRRSAIRRRGTAVSRQLEADATIDVCAPSVHTDYFCCTLAVIDHAASHTAIPQKLYSKDMLNALTSKRKNLVNRYGLPLGVVPPPALAAAVKASGPIVPMAWQEAEVHNDHTRSRCSLASAHLTLLTGVWCRGGSPRCWGEHRAVQAVPP